MTQQVHPMLPKESDSEKSRGRFVQALKSHIANRVTPGVRELYEHRAKPGWETNHGKEPQNRHEVRQSLTQMAPAGGEQGDCRRSKEEPLLDHPVPSAIPAGAPGAVP